MEISKETKPVQADKEIKPATDIKQKKEKNQKNKEPFKKTLLRILISVVIIGLGIFVVLFCVAKAADYNSISDMLQHMSGELALMWERITA